MKSRNGVEHRRLGLRRRSRLEVLADVLQEASRGSKKDKIVKNVNLNHTFLQKYLKFLLDKELIERRDDRNGDMIYRTTGRGRAFLSDYQRVLEYL